MLLETVEELFIDIRKEIQLDLTGCNLHLFFLSLPIRPIFILRSMTIEIHGDVLLLLGLIADKRQWHEERTCHQNHRTEIGV
jgi:hypothetical protein